MIYPDDMDSEVIPICDALNALPGVTTHYSCIGHGRGNGMYPDGYVMFTCENGDTLRYLTRWTRTPFWAVVAIQWHPELRKYGYTFRWPTGDHSVIESIIDGSV